MREYPGSRKGWSFSSLNSARYSPNRRLQNEWIVEICVCGKTRSSESRCSLSAAEASVRALISRASILLRICFAARSVKVMTRTRERSTSPAMARVMMRSDKTVVLPEPAAADSSRLAASEKLIAASCSFVQFSLLIAPFSSSPFHTLSHSLSLL